MTPITFRVEIAQKQAVLQPAFHPCQTSGHPERPKGIQDPQCAERIYVGRVFWRLKGNSNVALGRQVVYFSWLYRLNYTDEAVRIGQISIMQSEMNIGVMRILIKMVDPTCIE